jgi:hypothetical protein
LIAGWRVTRLLLRVFPGRPVALRCLTLFAWLGTLLIWILLPWFAVWIAWLTLVTWLALATLRLRGRLAVGGLVYVWFA